MEFFSKHIRYFIAVAQEGSVSKAAVRLCITASPLSQRIKELENSLNTQLFRRSHNARLTLTCEGERLYNKLMPLYEEVSVISKLYRERNSVNIGIYGPLPRHVDTIIDYIHRKDSKTHVNVFRCYSGPYIKHSDIEMADILISIKSLDNNLFSTHLASRENVKLIYKKGLIAQEVKKLPLTQSTYFSATKEFKSLQDNLKANGYSQEVLEVDNIQLRNKFVMEGKALMFVMDSMSCLNDMGEDVFISDADIDAFVTHHIYSTKGWHDLEHYLNSNTNLHWVAEML